MYTTIIAVCVIAISLGFLLFGFRLLNINILNLLTFNSYKIIQRFSSSRLTGLFLGLTTSESGLFGYLNRTIAENENNTNSHLKKLIDWNLLGQYLFVFILLLPFPLFIAYMLAYFALIYWIDRKIFPHSITVLVALILIKYSVILLLFSIDYIHQSDIQVFEVFQHFAGTIYFTSSIGFLLGFLVSSLASALILATILLVKIQATTFQSILMLACLHLGMSCYYLIRSAKLREFIFQAVKFAMKSHFIYAILFGLIASIIYVFKVTAFNMTDNLITFSLTACALAFLGLLVNSVISFRSASKQRLLTKIDTDKYFSRYAFTNSYAGLKLFTKELAQAMVPLQHYTSVMESYINEKGYTNNVEILHSSFKQRFRELQSYLKKLKRFDDGTRAAEQSYILVELVEDLRLLEENIYKKTLALKSFNIPEGFDVNAVSVLNNFIQAEDAILSTFISLLENPNKEDVGVLKSITANLSHSLPETTELKSWIGVKLATITEREESALRYFFEIYASDIEIILKVTDLFEEWINFLPRYDPDLAHLQYQ